MSSTRAAQVYDATSTARSRSDRLLGSEHLAVADFVLVAGLAFLLGLVRIGVPSLWVDEAFTAQFVREQHLNPLDTYHWIYYALLTPWSWIAGTSEASLRLPSVASAALACCLLVVLGRAVVGRWAALVSGLLLATSPFVVKWSQQARSYTLVLAAGILASLLLVRALEVGSRASWGVYGLGFSVVFALQPVSALVLVPAHGVLILQRRGRVLPHGLLAACVVVVLGVPWAFARAHQTTDKWLQRPTPHSALDTLLSVSGATGFGAVLAVVGTAVLWRARERWLGSWLFAWAFAPFMLAFLLSFLRPIYLDRYLITAAPGFALLGGVAVVWTGRRLGTALAAVAIAMTVVGVAGWYSTGHDGNWRGEGWRQAVAAVERRQGRSEPIVIVPWWAAPAASYYGARVEGTSTADSIWVLDWSETGHGLPATVRKPLGFGDHRLVEEIPFGWRVSAQHWERPG